LGGSLRISEVPLGIFAAPDHKEGSQETCGFLHAFDAPLRGLFDFFRRRGVDFWFHIGYFLRLGLNGLMPSHDCLLADAI
jgi:hypothetical protein